MRSTSTVGPGQHKAQVTETSCALGRLRGCREKSERPVREPRGQCQTGATPQSCQPRLMPACFFSSLCHRRPATLARHSPRRRQHRRLVALKLGHEPRMSDTAEADNLPESQPLRCNIRRAMRRASQPPPARMPARAPLPCSACPVTACITFIVFAIGHNATIPPSSLCSPSSTGSVANHESRCDNLRLRVSALSATNRI